MTPNATEWARTFRPDVQRRLGRALAHYYVERCTKAESCRTAHVSDQTFQHITYAERWRRHRGLRHAFAKALLELGYLPRAVQALAACSSRTVQKLQHELADEAWTS